MMIKTKKRKRGESSAVESVIPVKRTVAARKVLSMDTVYQNRLASLESWIGVEHDLITILTCKRTLSRGGEELSSSVHKVASTSRDTSHSEEG